MKKLISLLLVCIMIMMLCTACKTEPVDTDELRLSEVGEYPIVENGEVELTVWTILSSDCTDYQTNQQSIWYEDYSGVKVKYINVPSSGWADAFQLSIMNGDLPDVYLYDFDSTEVDICAEYDAIIPLNELIENYAPNIKAYLEANPEIKKTITNPDGDIYSLFCDSYSVGEAYKQKLWVNRNWLDKYTAETGKSMPETTEDFKNMLLFFKNNDMNGNGKSDEIPFMGCTGVDGINYLANAFIPCNSSSNGFGCVVDENGNCDFAYNKEDFREALKYINDLYNNGLISDQTFTISTDERYDYTSVTAKEIKVGVCAAPSVTDVVLLGNSETDYNSYVAIPPLEGPRGVRGAVTAGENIVSLRNAITTACENPDVAMRWLDYYYSEEGRLWTVNAGLEGEHWDYENVATEDGTESKVLVHKESLDIYDNFCWGNKGVAYMLRESDLAYMNKNDIATNAMVADYNANTAYSKYGVNSGWPAVVWVTPEVKTAADDYSSILGLVKNYVTQSYTEFVLGTKDINDDKQWDSYVQELDELGVERLVDLTELYISLG